MLTFRQKRENLVRVVRARVSELADDSDLWQVTITEDGVKLTLPYKLRAIALDNELAGEGHSNADEMTVVVRIGGPDNDGFPYDPTWGSTPAMMEKAMGSGIRARSTTMPPSRSPRTLEVGKPFFRKIFGEVFFGNMQETDTVENWNAATHATGT